MNEIDEMKKERNEIMINYEKALDELQKKYKVCAYTEIELCSSQWRNKDGYIMNKLNIIIKT